MKLYILSGSITCVVIDSPSIFDVSIIDNTINSKNKIKCYNSLRIQM